MAGLDPAIQWIPYLRKLKGAFCMANADNSIQPELSAPSSDDVTNKFFSDARQMGEKLGLKPDLLIQIVHAEDWAFCVQANCIIEICVNHILEREVKTGTWRTSSQQNVLDDFWPSLPLNGRSGRLRLVRQLGVLPDIYCEFIEELTSLRNRYCHDARNLNLSLSELLASSDQNIVRSRRRRLVGLPNCEDAEMIEVFAKKPKFLIWLTLISLLGFTYLMETQPSPLASLLGLADPNS
jgi:hypothetical protein